MTLLDKHGKQTTVTGNFSRTHMTVGWCLDVSFKRHSFLVKVVTLAQTEETAQYIGVVQI